MENFATEFMTKLDGKLTPEQMKTVLMELEMFSANFDIEKKITEIVRIKTAYRSATRCIWYRKRLRARPHSH